MPLNLNILRRAFHSPARLRARMAGAALGHNVHLAKSGSCIVKSGASITFGSGVSFHRDYEIMADEGAEIVIGDGVHFGARARLTAGPYARICIAQGCWFNHDIAIDCRKEIKIGKGGLFGPYSYINDNNHCTQRNTAIREQNFDAQALTIGEDVWLGVGATLIRGCRVENGAVIAARAVVNTHIPAYEIWGGIPAKRLGIRSEGNDCDPHP